MSVATVPLDPAAATAAPRVGPRHLAIGRAVLAFVWAAALATAVGDRVPTTTSEVPTAAALLLASYPLIDVVASVWGSRFADAGVLRANAAVSSVAAIGIAGAAFGSDAGATLVVFGAWAVVSGVLQLGLAIRRRAHGGQLPMIVSGGLSAIAGFGFIAASGNESGNLTFLAGYMAMGSLLFLLWARRRRATTESAGS